MSESMTNIEIDTGNSWHSAVVPAHVFGDWAAHCRWPLVHDKSWTLTHVPSGMCVPFYEDTTKTVAVETARLLGECGVKIKIKDGKVTGALHVMEAIIALALSERRLPWTVQP